MRALVSSGALVLGLSACVGKSSDAGENAGDTGIVTATDDAASGAPESGVDSDPSAGSATSTTSPTGGADDSGSGAGSSGGSGGVDDPLDPVDCGGKTYACGDGEDNDEDGFPDLLDPECTGPCDDDETSFQTGIPGDNMDCKQDCFFDGNSGQGDDGCIWNLKCDPANPGSEIGCAYTGGQNCNNSPPNQDEGCIMFCTQFVPPGCDCFGCCTVQTDGGEVHIFLNGDPDCSLDNLDACTTCTPNDSCNNPCVPEQCDICFGEIEPPQGCDEPGCSVPNLTACSAQSDCPTNYYCLSGCCYPPPPG